MGPKRGRIGREGKKAKGLEGRGQRTMLGKQNVGCQWWKEESGRYPLFTGSFRRKNEDKRPLGLLNVSLLLRDDDDCIIGVHKCTRVL